MSIYLSYYELLRSKVESRNKQMTKEIANQRDGSTDFFRGLAILGMFVVHYSRFFPKTIEKIVVYHDIAVDSFLLIAGLSIGRYYINDFKIDKKKCTLKLVDRTIKIIIVQYILIVTVSLVNEIVTNRIDSIKSLFIFLAMSFTFSNQLPLMHILPTFIPMLLMSPIVLLFLESRLYFLVLPFSFALFLAGQINPYFFSYGDRTIFPFILWQSYFVIGCYLGKKTAYKPSIITSNANKILISSTILLLVSLVIMHSSSLSICISKFKADNIIVISKFPLNIYGLLYGLTIIIFIFSLVSKLWDIIKCSVLTKVCKLFGRHSLLVFFIHVYYVKIASILYYYKSNYIHILLLIYSLILLNVVFTYVFLRRYETSKNNRSSYFWSGIRYLFG